MTVILMFVYNKGESIKGFDNKLSVVGVMADLVHVELFDPFAHFFQKFSFLLWFEVGVVAEVGEGHSYFFLLEFRVDYLDVVLGDLNRFWQVQFVEGNGLQEFDGAEAIADLDFLNFFELVDGHVFDLIQRRRDVEISEDGQFLLCGCVFLFGLFLCELIGPADYFEIALAQWVSFFDSRFIGMFELIVVFFDL